MKYVVLYLHTLLNFNEFWYLRVTINKFIELQKPKLLILLLFIAFTSIKAQKVKFGFNFTYDLYSNLDEIDGIKSSWRTLYTYNSGSYFYDESYHNWPYDQLNMDISMQIGSKAFVIEPFFSFTILKGWYSVSYNDGKYVADEPVLYLPESVDNPLFIDGDPYLYARGSGRMGQKRYGANIMFGDEAQIGIGIWWQKQKIELYKSTAFNRYWYDVAYSSAGYDGYVTSENEIYVMEPTSEMVYKKRLLFPLIIRFTDKYISYHVTFIFQKPFQLLIGSGFYF